MKVSGRRFRRHASMRCAGRSPPRRLRRAVLRARQCRHRRRMPNASRSPPRISTGSSPSPGTRASTSSWSGRKRRWCAGLVDRLDRGRHQDLRPHGRRRRARRLQGLHQGPLRQIRHPDRRLPPLHRCLEAAKAYIRDRGRADRRQGGRARGRQGRHRRANGRGGAGRRRGRAVRRTPSARPARSSSSRNSSTARRSSCLRALSTARSALMLAAAQDHKAVGDGDTGPNTGGMGAYSPGAGDDRRARRRVIAETIIRPTVAAMEAEGRPYKGVLYAGLMITAQRAEAHRIQRPLRRPGMPGADAAPQVRPAAGADRRLRRRARHLRSPLARRGGADGRDGAERLSRRLREGHRDPRPRRPPKRTTR